ncbi:hypothetical protein [Acinetobacter phage Ab69]|nr:hypothetical protein [Acinetobacter phage Ab69]
MKPEQFIREFGVDKAREVVEWAPEGATHYGLRQYRQWEGRILKTFTEGSWRSTAVFGGNLRFIEDDCLCIQDLKRLVESLDLVESYGGIESCKQSLYMLHELTEDPEPIREAVRDHESIYGQG